MKEMDRLLNLLFPLENDGYVVDDLKFFPGEQQVTVEEFCKEAHSAFVQVETGQSFMTRDLKERINPISLDRFLAHA